MQDFPHHYRIATRVAGAEGDVTLSGDGLPDLATAPPAEFGGKGDRWSPETLLVGAVCDCFVLGFKAIAAASRLTWTALDVEVADARSGRPEDAFTHFVVTARLRCRRAGKRAPRILESEEACLITNSCCGVGLESEVVVG
jgi:organic hydroperoxide reductase OsmC/OhrA